MPGLRAMGAEGIDEASDLSVLANNYMDSASCCASAASRDRNPESPGIGWR